MRNLTAILLASTVLNCATIASAQAVGSPQAEPADPSVSRPAQPDDQTLPPAPAQSTPTADTGGIEDIVVTATRRNESLQRIPVTVTAVTAAALNAGGITDTRLLTQIVPGLTFTRSTSVGQPVIRGVGSTGTSNGDESNVATYIDGVYQADPKATQIELVNIDRVEVLRGPQGTVFGRNATGGLINIITPDPSFESSGTVSAIYGRMRNNADDVDIRANYNGPINDVFAVYASGLYRYSEGYIDNLLGGTSYGGSEVAALRGKLLFQPNPDTRIILTVDYATQDSAGPASQPVGTFTRARSLPGVILPSEPWQASVDIAPIVDYNRFSASLRTSFDLNFATLETTGAYNFSRSVQQVDTDSTNLRIAAAAPTTRSRTYSQEIRLLSKSGGAFNWILGGYGFYLWSPTVSASLTAATPTLPYSVSVLSPTVTTTSFAGFAEGTYEVTTDLFLTAGIRYTTEHRTLVSYRDGVLLIPETSRDYNQVTYRGAFRYQVTPRTNVYGSYGTGFKSGVFNAIATALNVVEPERIRSVEFGIKSDLNRALRANISVYHYDYKNLQVTARDPVATASFVLQNAAVAEIYGGELEVTARPTSSLSLTGFITYAHSRYKSFQRAQSFLPQASGANTAVAIDASGNQLVRAPTWTFNISPKWSQPLGTGTIDIGGSVFHSSRVYWDFANTNAFSQKPYTFVTAYVGFETSNRWRFDLAATNLFNEVVAQQIRVGTTGTDQSLKRPRRVSLSARYAF